MTRQDFDSFALSVRSKLLALAWRYKASADMKDDPEDIVQDALLTLWRLISEGYPVRDKEALAVKITKNLAAASLRRQREDSVSIQEIDLEGGTSATEITDEEDRRTIRDELYKSLTDTQRHYLELRNELGLSLDDIAKMTGKPKTSIKTTLSNARKQLLEKIRKQI
ncbi:MAG: sigma-70 family RNA polymerase sigma factor [Bacteroidaceae bacterium]|nr:sigma-70 family RNA polymerase sigma factor [Bacteroidaceae bacterium]